MSTNLPMESVRSAPSRARPRRIAQLLVYFMLVAVAALTVGIAAYFPGYVQDIDTLVARLLRNDNTSATPIKIAFVGDLSRASRPGNSAILNGARIAVDETNARGGVAGRPLAIEAFDDAGDEDT
jgi:ABC-type branched-subunit amino acid transport system substrate-binding protein